MQAAKICYLGGCRAFARCKGRVSSFKSVVLLSGPDCIGAAVCDHPVTGIDSLIGTDISSEALEELCSVCHYCTSGAPHYTCHMA